jgi:quercetin dioxygenase-like cupin family protein
MVGGAAPSRGSQELCAWWVTIEPGADGPLHRVDHEIVLMVFEGEASVHLEGEDTVVPAGDAFILPAGQERKLANFSAERCRLVSIMPAGGRSIRSDGSPSFIPWAS